VGSEIVYKRQPVPQSYPGEPDALIVHVGFRPGGGEVTPVPTGPYAALCYTVFPGINEIPQQALPTVVDAVTDAEVTFPPTVLWAFRISSLGLQVVMWSTIALVFGALAHRPMEPNVRREREASSPRLLASEHRA
jgi:hypothetical protein